MNESGKGTTMHAQDVRLESVSALPQGDLRLLQSDVAKRLLTSREVASLAYVATDGTPRVIPMNFHWTGDELVMGAFAGTYKIPALRANPNVAITIDTFDDRPEALLIRGQASLTDVDGIVPEYVLAMRRYMGEGIDAYLSTIDQLGLTMVRVAVRPTWVGVLDFQIRFPERMPRALRS
jgi:hypothetical protein